MTKTFILGTVLFGALTLGLAAQDHGLTGKPPPAPAPTPVIQPVKPLGPAAKIFCPQPVFDFGEAPQNDKVEHSFEIVNKGDAQLEITNVQPTCSCTAAMPEKRFLQPNEATNIKAVFETKTFQGPITKTITVMCNDPTTPTLSLTISGKVLQPFHVTITELNYGMIKKGQPMEPKSFEIMTGGSGTITDARSDNPQVKAAFEPLPASSRMKGYKITVTVDGSLPVGQLRSMVTLTTDVPAQRALTVPVIAMVEGEINVKPRTFNFGKVKKGDGTTKIVEIEKSGAPDLKIEGVEVKPEGAFTAKLEEVKPGQAFKLVLALAADAKEGYSRGTVTIKTNCAGENLIQVYFYALVQ